MGEKPRIPRVEKIIEEAQKRLEKVEIKGGDKWEEALREFELKQEERGKGKRPEDTGDSGKKETEVAKTGEKEEPTGKKPEEKPVGHKVEHKEKVPTSGGLADKTEGIDSAR